MKADHAILFDEDCGFCKWSLERGLRLDRDQRLRPVPIQSDEGKELLSEVAVERRLESMHLVDPSGCVSSGGQALAPLAEVIPYCRLVAALFERFPKLADTIYDLIAANRFRLGRWLKLDQQCQVQR